MRYKIKTKRQFRKSLKRLSLIDRKLVSDIVKRLQNGEILEKRFRDHALVSDKAGQRDCHIKANLVLLYTKHDDILVLELLDVGSHSYLGID